MISLWKCFSGSFSLLNQTDLIILLFDLFLFFLTMMLFSSQSSSSFSSSLAVSRGRLSESFRKDFLRYDFPLKSYHAAQSAKVKCSRLAVRFAYLFNIYLMSFIGFKSCTLSLGRAVFINSTSHDDFFIGSCKTIYTASCALISTLFKNLFPMSRTCCFMLELPFLALAYACRKSSLIPF